MLQKLVVVTDSTSDFPPGTMEKLGINVIPLYVRFGEEEFLDKIDLSSDQFFAKLKQSSVLPTTSQPNPSDFVAFYKNIGVERIISIHAPAKLSGTINSAMVAKSELSDNFDIRIIDSQTLSLGLGFLAIKAAEMAKAGKDINDIEKEIYKLIPKVKLYGVLDTLFYAAKGGRVSNLSSWFGSILQVKPIIQIRDGGVMPVERPLTKKRAVNRLIEIIRQPLLDGEITLMGVLHAAAEDEAEELAVQIHKIYPNVDIPIVQTGTVIGTHSGPGLVGICYLLR